MKICLSLITLFILAFLLRFYLLPQNLFFGPEQGIDFQVIRDIVVNHKLTLIGSKTDISGIFHGPIYYYLAVLPFAISHGNPVIVSLFFIILNSLSVFFIYFLGKIIGGQRVGLIAAVILAFSFESIVYSRWLSSPPLAIPLSILFFYFFYRFINGSKRDLLFAAVTFGLLNQVEFLNIIFFFVIAFGLFVVFLKYFKKQNPIFITLCLLLGIGITIGTYVFFDLRHDFLISKSLLSLIGGDTGYHTSLTQTVSSVWNSEIRVFSRTIFPVSFIGSLILLLIELILLTTKIIKKEKNFYPLFIWFLFPIALLIFSRHNILDQFFVSLISLFIILTALLIDFLWQNKKIIGLIALATICIVNLYTWWDWIPSNRNVFFQSTQPGLRYADKIATIDEIYKDIDKKPFSFQSYTIPYWMQQGWQYLFWSYGKKRYGYEPISQNAKSLYVIIQDDPSNKLFQSDWLKNTVSKWGKPVKTFKHGIITTIKLEVINEL